MFEFDFDALDDHAAPSGGGTAGKMVPAAACCSLSAGFDPAGTLEALGRDGFHVFTEFLPSESLPSLRAAYDAHLASCAGPSGELAIACRWDDEAVAPFLRVLLDERLLDLLASICGLPFVAITLDFFGKRPHSGTMIPWHQDTYTTLVGFEWMPAKAAAGLRPHPATLWVALDDVCAQNGGMEMVPGRHTELLSQLHPSKMQVPEESISGDDRVEYRMAAGQAGLHHPLAPHRSCPNETDRPRRAFSFQLSPWTARVEELCGSLAQARPSPPIDPWPEWRSLPSGRYVLSPGNASALKEGHTLSRLLICRDWAPPVATRSDA